MSIDPAAYEGDIVSRLRHWRGLHLAHGGELFEAAADEIERLRLAVRRLADQDATLSVCDGSVTVEMDATLTDAEREAVQAAITYIETPVVPTFLHRHAATLRGLLGRCAIGSGEG